MDPAGHTPSKKNNMTKRPFITQDDSPNIIIVPQNKMTERPFITQDDSPNIIIVPTATFCESLPKKIRVDNNDQIKTNETPEQRSGSSMNSESCNLVTHTSESSDNQSKDSSQSIQSMNNATETLRPSWASNYLMSIGNSQNPIELNLTSSRKKIDVLKDLSKNEITQLTALSVLNNKRTPNEETKGQQMVHDDFSLNRSKEMLNGKLYTGNSSCSRPKTDYTYDETKVKSFKTLSQLDETQKITTNLNTSSFLKSVNNRHINRNTGPDKQCKSEIVTASSSNFIATPDKYKFTQKHYQNTNDIGSDTKYRDKIIAPSTTKYVLTPDKYKYIKKYDQNNIETGSDKQCSNKIITPSTPKYISTPDKYKYIKYDQNKNETGSDKQYRDKLMAPSTSKYIPTTNKYKFINHDQNTNKDMKSKKGVPNTTNSQYTTKLSVDKIKSRQALQSSKNKIVKTSQQTGKDILRRKNTSDMQIKSKVIKKSSPIRKNDFSSYLYDIETIKYKEFYNNYKIPKISEKNIIREEKTKTDLTNNNNSMNRLSAKDVFAKELDDAHRLTPVKSVVKVVDDTEQKLHTTFDLRSKLSRRSLSHYFTKLRNLSESELEPADSAPREERDSLLITVSNDTDDDFKATGKRKLEDIKTPKKKEATSTPRKFKKIKLVINVICEKSANSSSDTDDEELLGTSDTEKNNVISNLDLSFLDDLNIDEIVQSLCSKEKCDLTSFEFKENAANDFSLKDNANELNNIKDNNTDKEMLSVHHTDTENERSQLIDNELKIGSSVHFSDVLSVKEHINIIIDTNKETLIMPDILKTEREDTICKETKHMRKSNEVPVIMETKKKEISVSNEFSEVNNTNIETVYNISTTREPSEMNINNKKLDVIETNGILDQTEDNIIIVQVKNENPETICTKIGTECDIKNVISEINDISYKNKVEDVQEKLKLEVLDKNYKSRTNNTNMIDQENMNKKQIVKSIDKLKSNMSDEVKKDGIEIKFGDATQISNQIKKSVISLQTLDEKTQEFNIGNSNKHHALPLISNTGLSEIIISETPEEAIVTNTDESKKNKKQSETENTNQTNTDESNIKTTEHKQEAKTENSNQKDDAFLTETNEHKRESKIENSSEADNDESVAITTEHKLESNTENSSQANHEIFTKTTKQSEHKIQPETVNTRQASITNKKLTVSDDESKKGTDVYLEKRLEDRMKQYLNKKHTITSLLHYGEFSKIYKCVNDSGEKYALKVIMLEKKVYKNSTIDYLIMKELQRDVPRENYHCVFLLNGFGFTKHWCLLMELYPKNLKQALQENKKSFHINVIKQLSRQLVSAVTLLRHNNIVHTNIKPTHILVNSANDHLKLCGFDEAQYKNDIQFSRNIGPMNYRAPEVILGHSAGFNMDVWSTALVMYEMATNIQLFPGKFHNDILYKQMFVCGPVPCEMIQQSKYKSEHFRGLTFMRQLKGGKYIPVLYNAIRKHDLVKKYVFLTYKNDWHSGVMSYKERQLDYAKLNSFCQLLHKMLIMDPQQRLPIEFVYADPFLFDLCG